MSGEAARRIRKVAEATVLEAAWSQWSALTTAAVPVGERRAWTIVDPEALVLASLTVSHRERRLDDLLAAWAMSGVYLMSVQRMRTLAKRYPQRVQDRLTSFARAAIAGGDGRWESLATNGRDADEYVPRKKDLGRLRLLEGPALTLRLRAGFGVNAKADLLSLLLGWSGVAAGLKVIAAATAYTERAIRTATGEMTLAGFIHEIEGRPSSFYAEPEAWARLLHTDRSDRPSKPSAIPPWHFWAAIFAFFAEVIEWADHAEVGEWSTYVAGSKARDLVELHRRTLIQAHIDLRPESTAPGAEYIGDFEELVRRVQAWTRESLDGRG